MARLAPISGILLKPRGEPPTSPAIALSLAAKYEEPDLSIEGTQGWASELAHAGGPTLDECLARNMALRTTGTSLVIAHLERRGEVACGLYCHYPLRLVKELAEVPFAPSDAYRALLKRHRAAIDPLVLAVPGVRDETLAAMQQAGKELTVHRFVDGTVLTMREVSDEREVRALLKPFEPGLFSSRPSPFVLDGPLAEAKKAAEAGVEHVFACLIPVGGTANRLLIHALMIEGSAQGEPSRVSEAEARKARALPRQLATFADGQTGYRLRRYHFSDEGSRAAASEDWEEDLRIEARFGPCSAVLLRGHDEFLLASTSERGSGIGIAPLYAAGALLESSRRVVLAHDEQAHQVFLKGQGDAVVWTPFVEDKDITQRVLASAPPITARRAMLGLALPIPLGVVCAANR